MEPHHRLHVFLPKLRLLLMRAGMSKESAKSVCDEIFEGNAPPPIATQEAYEHGWAVCDAMGEILTTLDDKSEAAAYCTALAHRLFDYEDEFEAQHGYKPLNAEGSDSIDGPHGRA